MRKRYGRRRGYRTKIKSRRRKGKRIRKYGVSRGGIRL